MNIKEVKGIMDLAIEEVNTAQILLESGLYRGSITHSYYAMFDAARALLLTKDYIASKHDNTLKQFSKDFVKDADFPHEVYKYYSDAKDLRKKSSYDFSVSFTKIEAEEYINHAEEFIIEVKRFLKDII